MHKDERETQQCIPRNKEFFGRRRCYENVCEIQFEPSQGLVKYDTVNLDFFLLHKPSCKATSAFAEDIHVTRYVAVLSPPCRSHRHSFVNPINF